ncbi:MAG: rhomboid family intramembrane serine protease [Bacteroidetes bacterium]|nr:rhomboid family intramembrane serine protease [Bacteroidota bacterium]
MNAILTYMIIGITCVAYITAMNDPVLKMRYMFNAYAIAHRREWFRFFTHGLLHADFAHLLFNMLSLYFFGVNVERAFKSDELFGPGMGTFYYLLIYVGGLFVSSVYSFFKHRDNVNYNALGASGAVSAIIFTSILLFPMSRITLFILPIPVQAWIYGLFFLLISYLLARRNVGNIGHDAHFWGAVWGFVIPIIIKPHLWNDFLLLISSQETFLR